MKQEVSIDRPVIYDYRTVRVFLNDTYRWHKHHNPEFSIRQKTQTLYRCSPALVTKVLRNKRRLTVDRVNDFGRVFDLTPEEVSYLNKWVQMSGRASLSAKGVKLPSAPKKRIPTNHLIRDWLNIYVKDCTRLYGFLPKPEIIHRLLGGIASRKRIERSLQFLLREGFLRKTLDGRIVEHETVTTTTDGELNLHLQKLHRKALDIARRGIRTHPLSKRRESLVVLPLNQDTLVKMKALLREFYEKLLSFAEEHPHDNEALYQVIINLSPIGGSSNENDIK